MSDPIRIPVVPPSAASRFMVVTITPDIARQIVALAAEDDSLSYWRIEAERAKADLAASMVAHGRDVERLMCERDAARSELAIIKDDVSRSPENFCALNQMVTHYMREASRLKQEVDALKARKVDLSGADTCDCGGIHKVTVIELISAAGVEVKP